MMYYNAEEKEVSDSIFQFSFFRYSYIPHTARTILIIQLIATMLDDKWCESNSALDTLN